MTTDLQSVLTAPLTRRRLLQSVGVAGLTVAFSTAIIGASKNGSNGVAAAAQAAGPQYPMDVDSYLVLHEDGTVTLMSGKVEYGQGIQTGYGQLIAEELSIPFESVEVLCGTDTSIVPYDGNTTGSRSTRDTGIRLRKAAAEMREWLLELGAEELGVPTSELSVQDGAVVVTGSPESQVAFATLASSKQGVREIRDDVPLKDPSEYTIVGQDIPRVDVPAKVTGEMIFGIDAEVEGMVYGKVVRAPARGSTLKSVDFSVAETMPGVVGTYHDGDFAGLAAETLEQAEAALAAVVAEWELPETTTTHETIFDLLKNTPDEGQALGVEEGEEAPDLTDALASADQKVSATFKAPFVSHAPMEPKSALADVREDGVTLWTANQGPFLARTRVAELLGRPEEEIVILNLMGGGAFGSKVQPDAEIEAARLSQAVGRPVKIIWTRQEEYQEARFRPAMLIELEAGLDADGNISAWHYDLYSAAYFPEGAEEPSRCAAQTSADATLVYRDLPAATHWYQSHTPLPPYFWRGNGAAINVFATEVTLDELAELAGQDPVTFRTNLLQNNPKMKAVMDAVVEKAGWEPGVGSTGQGIGMGLTFETGACVGAVARVSVNEETGVITVHHVDTSIDCGLVLNPLAVRQQAEGSVIHSLSPTLREAVTFENGRVTNATFGQMRPIKMSEAPTVDVVFVEDKSEPMQGVGEPFVAPIPAAISNAVYDAVGIRLRELPFTPDKVLAALAERG